MSVHLGANLCTCKRFIIMIFSIQSTCLLWRVGKRESERPAAARSKELGSQNENGLNLKLKTVALRLGSIIIHFIPNLEGVIIS